MPLQNLFVYEPNSQDSRLFFHRRHSPGWCSMFLVVQSPPPCWVCPGNSGARRAGPAWPAPQPHRERDDRERRSAPGSKGSRRQLSQPCSGSASVAFHVRSTSGGGDRTSWTVVFLIPRHILQGDRRIHRGFSSRNDPGGLVMLERERTGQLLFLGWPTIHDCALGWTGPSGSPGAPTGTPGCGATRL